MSEKRCFMCGNFLIYKNGEFICPNCNSTISEEEYIDGDLCEMRISKKELSEYVERMNVGEVLERLKFHIIKKG